MPNGGTDNCGECLFAEALPEHRARCRIRRVEIDVPHWTYCANNQVTNPEGIEIPLGPVYVIGDGYPYRRVVLIPSEDGHLTEKLEFLQQVARGEWDLRTRKLQVGLIEDLSRQNVTEAIPLLVDLALAEPADLISVGFPGPGAEIFDMNYMWETDAVRVEFVRLASLRALRRFEMDHGADVGELLRARAADAKLDLLRRINLAIAFVYDGEEPP